MLCQICKSEEATVHIKEIINGKYTELHLCHRCAEERGLTESLLSPGSVFANLMSGLADFVKSPLLLQEEKKCPECGLPYTSIINKGKMGCASCYETFRDYIFPLLERIHGKATHRGKVPQRITTESRVKTKLYQLQRELEEAVKKEEYEKAAELRDKIRKMQKKDREDYDCSKSSQDSK